MGNSVAVCQEIRGWERDIQTDLEDNETETEILDFIIDPGNTRGCLTLFQQTIHTYWILKSLLAKAIQSLYASHVEQNPMKTEIGRAHV